MNIIPLMPTQGTIQQPTTKPAGEESGLDTNQDGVITPEELFSHFDADGDGKIDIIDYAAHILYHQQHPELLQPYLQQASAKLGDFEPQCAALSERLIDETLYVSDTDTNNLDKTKNALKKGEDVQVVKQNDLSRLKLKEHLQKLAGIIK